MDYASVYIAYVKLFLTDHCSRFTVGLGHAQLAPSRLREYAQSARKAGHTIWADAWVGAATAAGCNPLLGIDFVLGTGAQSALRRPPARGLLASSEAHETRLARLLDSEKVALTDYTERGIAGEAAEFMFKSAAIPTYAVASAVGRVLGVISWAVCYGGAAAVSRLGGRSCAAPTLAWCMETGGNIAGVVAGLALGLAAMALPFVVLIGARMPTLTIKAVFAGAGWLGGALLGVYRWGGVQRAVVNAVHTAQRWFVGSTAANDPAAEPCSE